MRSWKRNHFTDKRRARISISTPFVNEPLELRLQFAATLTFDPLQTPSLVVVGIVKGSS